MTTDATKRQDLIEGLRALADWYEQHPTVPLPAYPGWTHCVLSHHGDVDGPAVVRELAAALGAEVVERHGHTVADKPFGPIKFHAYYVSRERMQEHNDNVQFLAEHGRGAS